MQEFKKEAIALLASKATPEQLDDLVRQIQGLPARPDGVAPLKALFSYIEAKEGSKAATEATRSGYDPGKSVVWRDFNCKISKHFTVGELLRYDPNRIPSDEGIKQNIIAIAKEADKIREAWGSPIGVSSGYRPPKVNAACGGARYSQHLTGNALDIYPMMGSIYDFQKFVDAKWGGGLGYGARKGFVHIDLREGGWDRGSFAIRWNY